MNNELLMWQKRREEIIEWMLEHGYKRNTDAKEGNTSGQVFTAPDVKMKDLKVAAIMDRFTLESYSPECKLLELTPQNWKEEVDSFQPDMLFIESAWEGKDKLWYRKVDRYSEEMEALTKYLREKNVPIIFWNKEDPVYTDIFMLTASYADVVFTTDIDCIAKYRSELGHDKVYHLHFAAQPVTHNPIDKYNRQDKFCFAGAYYHKYKERSKVFDSFADVFCENDKFVIYDRNYGNARPEHAFPKRYDPYIVGSLPSNEIDKAYKGFTYGINMNSIQQSQTMFARRVFEMMASGTITVGNFSRGLKNYFGDLTICTDDNKTLSLYLQKYCSDTVTLRKYALLGLRKVLSEDLYEDRLGYITEKVYGTSMKPAMPKVSVLCKVDDEKDANRIIKMFNSQSYAFAKLYLVCNKPLKTLQKQYKCLTEAEAAKAVVGNKLDCDWVAVFDHNDWYGEHYLTDLVLTYRYLSADAVGKASYYASENGAYSLNEGERYNYAKSVAIRRSIISKKTASDMTIADLLSKNEWTEGIVYSTDEFNYCENCSEFNCYIAKDIVIADTGLGLQQIQKIAENIKPLELSDEVLRFTGEEISTMYNSANKPVKFVKNGKSMTIESALPEGKHEYIFLSKSKFEVAPWMRDGKLPVQFRGAGSLDLICVLVCFDKDDKRLSPVFPHLNRNELCQLPEGTVSVELGFRPKGSGTSTIKEVIIGAEAASSDHTCYLTRSNVLVLSNHYPSPEALYRNMFVHKRMTSYKADGKTYDVMRMNPYASECFREFEGINVIETKGSELISILESGSIDTVCVHFLDREMWEILKGFIKKIRLIIWSHGADIRPWWRRKCDFITKSELEEAKIQSENRMTLWREIFNAALNSTTNSINFVFVSQIFANEIMEDYKIDLSGKYKIIHNCIDVDLYQYYPKDAEMRKKILTIKPFTNPNYANDLTTKGIIELSKRRCFKNITIDIYGDGPNFETDTKELKSFKNVNLHKIFLTQSEISELHKTHGVFIATTRLDSQGVSRDEAMSSGLVPIANNCSAIPEFVDDNCGILIPDEGYIEVADAIEKLYNDPDLFLRLSENAAKRVRSQTSKPYTIDKEIALIENKL